MSDVLLRWLLWFAFIAVVALALISLQIRRAEEHCPTTKPTEERLFFGWYTGRGAGSWCPDTVVSDEDGIYLFADERANVIALAILRVPSLFRGRSAADFIGDAGPDHAVLFPGTRWEVEVRARRDTIIVVRPDLTQFRAPLEEGDLREIDRRLIKARRQSRTPAELQWLVPDDHPLTTATQPHHFSILDVVGAWAEENFRTELSHVLEEYGTE